jgi:hypothetical protein
LEKDGKKQGNEMESAMRRRTWKWARRRTFHPYSYDLFVLPAIGD